MLEGIEQNTKHGQEPWCELDGEPSYLEISSGDGEVWRYVNCTHICMCVCLYVLCKYVTIR